MIGFKMLIGTHTKCSQCGQLIRNLDDLVAYEAIVPEGHRLRHMFGKPYHRDCFFALPDAGDVMRLRDLYEKILRSVPRIDIDAADFMKLQFDQRESILQQYEAQLSEAFRGWPPKEFG